MGYEDFVWFMLSEEDKSTDVSLEYWFRCIDLDFDGVLRSNELLVRVTLLTSLLCIPLQKPFQMRLLPAQIAVVTTW